jgi:uncharacterized OB-fold protein/acyl dehydratase
VPDNELLKKLKSFEGRAGAASVGPDAVNLPMIRHWCEAIGDDNPVYLDARAAAASVHGEIIAPPTMLQAWAMRGIRGNRSSGNEANDELMTLLDEAGFTSVVATNCEQEYHRSVKLGDHLSTSSTIESVSEEKATGLGSGHFVTTRIRYSDEHGEPVADMLFRILKFKPGTGRSAAPAVDTTTPRPKRPRPAQTEDTSFFWEGARRHELLIQQCAGCGTLRHPPRPRCASCGSYEWDTVTSTGRGVVYSFVVNHYPQVPAFDYPLPVGLIELEEGTRLVANIVGIDPSAIEVGMPVEVEWVDHDDELSLPAFRPVAG